MVISGPLKGELRRVISIIGKDVSTIPFVAKAKGPRKGKASREPSVTHTYHKLHELIEIVLPKKS